MKSAVRMNPYLTVILLLCLLVFSYTSIIKNVFSSTDSLNTHLEQANVYNNASTLIKARLSARLDQQFQDRIVQAAIADRLLDAIVTPQFVEKQSQRVLPLAAKVISQPLDIENNKVVVDTKNYKAKVQAELAARNGKIPDFIEPTVNNLVTSVPNQLTLVDMTQRPNSILGTLTKAKIFFEHTILWNNIALTVGIVTGLLLLIINYRSLRTFFKYISIAYIISGIVIFIGSYFFPYLIMLFNTGPTIYLNQLVSDAAYYLFALTRMPSLTLLGLGLLFYLVFRLSYLDALQAQINKLLHVQSSKKKTHYATH
jgi:hypothetical protein